MKTASVTEAKNRLSELLDQVKMGNSIVITEHNRPVARIGPIPDSEAWNDAKLVAMARQGLIRLPSQVSDDIEEVLAMPKAQLRTAGPTVSEALLEERAGGR